MASRAGEVPEGGTDATEEEVNAGMHRSTTGMARAFGSGVRDGPGVAEEIAHVSTAGMGTELIEHFAERQAVGRVGLIDRMNRLREPRSLHPTGQDSRFGPRGCSFAPNANHVNRLLERQTCPMLSETV